MEWLTDFLTLPFLQRALLAGVMIGLMCGYYGVFIVQRGLSFLGDGLAHAAFGGVALGLLLGWTPLWVALPFTVLVSLGITYLREKTELQGDTAIGIFFAVSVALGVLFLGLKKDYTADAYTYLFGSILSVGLSDLYVMGGLLLLTVVLLPTTWRLLAYSTFDPELAQSDGINVRLLNYFLAVVLAVTVVISVKVIGIVMVASFLVIPAATARLRSHTLYQMTLWSAGLAALASLVGLLVSYVVDVPSGSTIILSQALFFLLAAVVPRRAPV